MTASQKTKTSISDVIKLIIFPGLVTLLSVLIWRGVVRIQDDIQVLLADNSTQKQQINTLEKEVNSLNKTVYHMTFISEKDPLKNNIAKLEQKKLYKSTILAMIFNLVGTKEEIYTIADHIKFY